MKKMLRELTPEQLMHWADDRLSVMRLNTDRDVLPGGYMAALSPLLVSWPALEGTHEGASVTLRNLNYGGNPLERKTVLQSVRFEIGAVESAELTLVPARELRGRSPVYHVQVRYIFKAGREPVLVNLAEDRTGTDARVPDIVLSWETWRDPDTPLDLRTSFGGRSCGLSLRAYAGAQRYLEDSIRQRKWLAYPLALPGGRRGVRELLAVSLAIGDGVARDALGAMLDAGEQAWLAQAPGGASDTGAERWRALKRKLPRETDFEDRLAPVPEGEKSYHLLLRSCATLTRYLILLSVRRLAEHGHAGDYDVAKLPDMGFTEVQPWMGEVAKGDLLSLFMCAPTALRFLLGHPASRPGMLPNALDRTGLLERRNGKRVEVVYARNATRPYGPDGIWRPE